MRLTFGLIGALALCAVARPVAAQERLDSSIRAWADIVIYSGDVLLPSLEVTSISPVLQAEVELGSWQLGLDLPMAFGDAQVERGAFTVDASGAAARLANPTLHIDYVIEPNPLRMSLGLALAIPTTGDDDDPDALGSALVAAAAAYARGMWNLWWYAPDAWTVFAPIRIDYAGSEFELGLEGALAWYLPRGERQENRGIFQLAGRAGAVAGPALIGVRLQGVLYSDGGLTGSDDFQSAAELFAELRLPILWLGAGALVALDEPLGLGDGAGFWGVRLSGGVGF